MQVSPVKNRSFRSLVFGQFFSTIGDSLYAIALPWYILATHHGVALLSATLTCYGLSRLVFITIGGSATDKKHPWSLMMSADIMRLLALLAFLILTIFRSGSYWTLLPFAILIGAGEGVFLPASFVIIPSIVEDDQLMESNAISASSTQIASVAGPLFGGLIVASIGTSASLFIDALTFGVSALTLWRISIDHRATERTNSSESDSPETESQARQPALWQTVRSSRAIQIMLLIVLVANLGSGGLSAVALPTLAHQVFKTTTTGYGLMLSFLGLGALTGTLLASRLKINVRPTVLASSAYIAEAVFLSIVPFGGGVLFATAALFFYGLLNGFGNITLITTVQSNAPRELLGRIMSLLLTATFGMFPVSVFLAGIVIRSVGTSVFFLLASALLAISVLVGLTQSQWRIFGSPATGK